MPLLPLLRSRPDCEADWGLGSICGSMRARQDLSSDPDSLLGSTYGSLPYSRSQTERRNWRSPTVRR